MKTAMQSNTIRLGIVQILSGVGGYLGGQMDVGAAATLVITGAIQIIQRLLALRNEAAQASSPEAPQSSQG